MEKKSERLEVRLGYEEKQEFTEACENQGDTPSGAIRRFISGYVRRSDADVLSSAWRGAAKRRGWRPVIFVAIFAVIAAAFLWIAQQKPFVSDDVIFTERDRNADGFLDYSEHRVPPKSAEEPSGFVRVLDTDGDGLIARDEFMARGRMAYILAGPKSDPIRRNQPRDGKSITVVEFEITAEMARTGSFSSKDVSLKKLDRLIIWHEDSQITVMEGPVDLTRGEEIIIKP